MIKKLLCLKMVSVFLAFHVGASEVATVMGSPDGSLDFVQSLVQERINLSDHASVDDVSTAVYSIFHRIGIQSAVSVGVQNQFGSSTESLFLQGISLGVQKAPIVYTNMGPVGERICSVMAHYPQTVFVLVAGNSGSQLDPGQEPSCLNGNILRVGALDQVRGELFSFSNWGPSVRIASPSLKIPAVGAGGVQHSYTNNSVGAALVAARMGVYATQHLDLRGAALVDKFLDESTLCLPALLGKVDGARALNDDGQ
jgi:hypothetical protein